MTSTLPTWDPFVPGYTDDPYAHLAELREHSAGELHPIGFHVVWRYAEVDQLLRAGLSVDGDRLPLDSAMRGLVPDVPEAGERPGMSMLDRDPPDHTRLRRLVSGAFTPRAIAALEPRIRALVEGFLDDMQEQGKTDLVDGLAFPLPFAVISEMLGMPPADAEQVRSLSGLIVRSLEPVLDPALAAEIFEADARMTELIGGVVAWKRDHPAGDLITALLAAEHEGDALTHEELVAQVVLLYIAGHETTVNLIAGGTLALLRSPDQLQRLRAEPDLLENAVEELLRYDPPVQMTRRITVEDVSVGDVEIPAGSFVVAHLAAANRDPRHFGPDADQLRLDRPDARSHLSFAAGTHHCLGAVLARLEARLAFEALLRRCPDLRLAGEPSWNGRINLRGPAQLPVTW